MRLILFITFLIINVCTFDITSFDINFFKEEPNLYYVNAMNNDNGDIYFEFWGEANKFRHFIGVNYLTEERLKFNDNEIYSIETNEISIYHESIIINNNDDINDINIFSMNYKYLDFIIIKNSKHTYKRTKDIALENRGRPSQRNSIIKLKDNTYILSLLLHDLNIAHYTYFKIFKFNSNEMNGYNELANKKKWINCLNSTSCVQTESQYIQCIIPEKKSNGIDHFDIGIYDLKLDEKDTFRFTRVRENSFAKLFHIKGEIVCYLFFDNVQSDKPTLFIKKLSVNRNTYKLENVISNKENIIENIGYNIDIGAFSTDATKIDDSRFVIFFTIKSSYNLLLCLFDFNKDYTAIKVRYYLLDFESINIQISVNIRSFLFKDYFGLLFYDSISQYPGYIFFNKVNLTCVNKTDTRTIVIKDFEDNSPITFSFLENLEFINNIYNGPIKIRIESFSSIDESGISTKYLNKNLEISVGDLLDLNDSLIFEKTNSQLHDYFLEFLPLVQEIDATMEIYGNYEENDFEQIGYFTKYAFNIIIPSGKNCSNEEFIYAKNEQEKFCLISCDSYKEKQLYQDETENLCYNYCSEAKNGNIYTFLYKCLHACPNEYIPDKNNFCIPNETSIFTENIYNENELERFEENNKTNSKNNDEVINNVIDEKVLDNFMGMIKSLIGNLESNGNAMEIVHEENSSSISLCYSSNASTESLINIDPELSYVKANECQNKLIEAKIIDKNDQVIIGESQDSKDKNDFNFGLYLSNGTKLDTSICQDTKVEYTLPADEKYLENAKELSEQGYDLFNLTSNLFNDYCISVQLDGIDITLETRQKNIMPDPPCPNGCEYNGVNISTGTVSCLCDFNFTERNTTIRIENKQEVKESFFNYIFNLINYKTFTCYGILNDWKNYISYYGFLIGAIIYLMIIILFFIYLCRGNKAIKIKYFLHEPKMDNTNKKSYIIDLSDVSKKFKLSSSRSNIILNDQNSLFQNQKPKKMKSNIKSNPPNSKAQFSSTKIKKENNAINNKKKSKNRRTKGIKSNIRDDEKGSKIIISMNKEIEKKEKNIEYNELTYAQAVNKDERNIMQIFFSYFNEKLDLIQIFFYPKEFDHFSLSLTLYLYELLIDFTLNALLFSDAVISQKYYNNGSLLFITSNILSIASNIFSSLFASLIEFLVNYHEVLDAAKLETNSEKLFYKIFSKIYKIILCKIRIFYFFVFISGLGCVYYLLIFCSIYKKIQKNLFINYIIGTLWSFGYKILLSILSTVLRKIALTRRYRRLYIISKFINEKL